jgi:hypothetical protein
MRVCFFGCLCSPCAPSDCSLFDFGILAPLHFPVCPVARAFPSGQCSALGRLFTFSVRLPSSFPRAAAAHAPLLPAAARALYLVPSSAFPSAVVPAAARAPGACCRARPLPAALQCVPSAVVPAAAHAMSWSRGRGGSDEIHGGGRGGPDWIYGGGRGSSDEVHGMGGGSCDSDEVHVGGRGGRDWIYGGGRVG